MKDTKTIPSLSAKELLVLDMLSCGRPMYGLEMVTTSGGLLKRGTVYVTLGRMEDKGYIESEIEPHRKGAVGLPRRLYRPTSFGAKVMEAWAMVRTKLALETH